MDSQSSSSPTIIQVVGPAGSGKSFFANQFSKTFGTAIISRDKIRWILFAHHTHDSDEESVVSQVSDLMISELLKTGKTFIVDGGYNSRVARNSLLVTAKKHNYKILTVVVQTDELTARKRSMKRDGRKSGDLYKQSLDESQYGAQLKTYQPPVMDRNTIVISGKHTYSTQAHTVLKRIAELRGNTSPVQSAQTRSTPAVRLSGPFIQ